MLSNVFSIYIFWFLYMVSTAIYTFCKYSRVSKKDHTEPKITHDARTTEKAITIDPDGLLRLICRNCKSLGIVPRNRSVCKTKRKDINPLYCFQSCDHFSECKDRGIKICSNCEGKGFRILEMMVWHSVEAARRTLDV